MNINMQLNTNMQSIEDVVSIATENPEWSG